MQTLDEVLNAAIKRLEKQNDSSLARAIGVTHVTVHNWRTRRSTPDNFALVQLAKILGRSPLELLGIIEGEKAKTDERKEYWQDFLAGLLETTKKLGVIGVITCASFTATTPRADAQQTTLKAETGNVYYVKRLLRRALGKRLFKFAI